MKKFIALVALASLSTSQAAWTDTLKKFETEENSICKASRLFDEGQFGVRNPAESYKSYRIPDMYLEQARVIFVNAFYKDGLKNLSPLKEELGGIYNQYGSLNKKLYSISMDPVSKYVTEVCVEIIPS